MNEDDHFVVAGLEERMLDVVVEHVDAIATQGSVSANICIRSPTKKSVLKTIAWEITNYLKLIEFSSIQLIYQFWAPPESIDMCLQRSRDAFGDDVRANVSE